MVLQRFVLGAGHLSSQPFACHDLGPRSIRIRLERSDTHGGHRPYRVLCLCSGDKRHANRSRSSSGSAERSTRLCIAIWKVSAVRAPCYRHSDACVHAAAFILPSSCQFVEMSVHFPFESFSVVYKIQRSLFVRCFWTSVHAQTPLPTSIASGHESAMIHGERMRPPWVEYGRTCCPTGLRQGIPLLCVLVMNSTKNGKRWACTATCIRALDTACTCRVRYREHGRRSTWLGSLTIPKRSHSSQQVLGSLHRRCMPRPARARQMALSPRAARIQLYRVPCDRAHPRTHHAMDIM